MRDIFIERNKNILRIAVKEEEKLMECYIEDDIGEAMPGEIYKGIVKNVVPAIKCAFIDIGGSKNAYLYVDKKIKKGQEVMVEVIKEEIGDKGPKVSEAVTIPGRLVVLHTYDNEVNFSKKISDKSFKEKVIKHIEKPQEVGITVRTKAEEASIEDIQKEVEELYKKFIHIKRTFEYTLNPKRISSENSIFYRILRDVTNTNTGKIYVDTKDDYDFIKNYLEDIMSVEIILHQENRTLFDYYGIEKEILALRGHRINLPCGGYIIIEKTEAMYTIDVNTGRNVHGRNMEKTIYETDLEAAKEAARQIRLRNLSGIIVIDFIDLKDKALQANILNKLKECFDTDSNKTVIYPFTELGLVQIARRRRGKNISDFIEEECPKCHGFGVRLKLDYISLLISNEIIKLQNENSIDNILIEINHRYKEEIQNDIFSFIMKINGLNKNIYIKYISGSGYFKVEPLLFQNQLDALKEYKVNL